MVSKNKSKSIAAPKALNSSKKSNLPDGLNYEVLCHTVIPTVIAYYAHQKDPWDQQPTHLYFCNYYPYLFKLPGYSAPRRQLVSSHRLCVLDAHHSVYLGEPAAGIQ